MKTNPVIVDKDHKLKSLIEISPSDKRFDEGWLQKLLHESPDVLPVHEIDAVFSPMVSIGREVVTGTGPIDNLFLSQRGYPILVETKLWRNPEARRQVVAQALDYASSLSQWGFSELDQSVRKCTKQNGAEKGLIELAEATWGVIEEGNDFFIDTVNKNLRLGRFLILIVSDKIHESTTPMVEFINRYPGLAFDMALIELKCYQLTDDELWPLFIVPRIAKRTEIVERSVVQVTIEDGKKPQVAVTQEKTQISGGTVVSKPTLTEEAFWEMLEKQGRKVCEESKKIVSYVGNNGLLTIGFATSALTVKMLLPDFGRNISVFYIGVSGNLMVYTSNITAQLNSLGFGMKGYEKYKEKVTALFKNKKKLTDMYAPITKVDVDAFLLAVDEFVAEIQAEAARRA